MHTRPASPHTPLAPLPQTAHIKKTRIPVAERPSHTRNYQQFSRTLRGRFPQNPPLPPTPGPPLAALPYTCLHRTLPSSLLLSTFSTMASDSSSNIVIVPSKKRRMVEASQATTTKSDSACRGPYLKRFDCLLEDGPLVAIGAVAQQHGRYSE